MSPFVCLRYGLTLENCSPDLWLPTNTRLKSPIPWGGLSMHRGESSQPHFCLYSLILSCFLGNISRECLHRHHRHHRRAAVKTSSLGLMIRRSRRGLSQPKMANQCVRRNILDCDTKADIARVFSVTHGQFYTFLSPRREEENFALHFFL